MGSIPHSVKRTLTLRNNCYHLFDDRSLQPRGINGLGPHNSGSANAIAPLADLVQVVEAENRVLAAVWGQMIKRAFRAVDQFLHVYLGHCEIRHRTEPGSEPNPGRNCVVRRRLVQFALKTRYQ
jgi:hypothetical protein